MAAADGQLLTHSMSDTCRPCGKAPVELHLKSLHCLERRTVQLGSQEYLTEGWMAATD